MTLDEAIKHAEEVMVENLEKTKGRNASDPIAIYCSERAEEHRQLAEWLKELKRLREQTEPERCGDCISRQAVDELSKALVHTTRDKADFLCKFWEELRKLPPVEPERKPGKWIGEQSWCLPKCSMCGASCFGLHGFDAIKTPYCPTCGAKMEVDE